MTLSGVHQRGFTERLNVTEAYSAILMQILKSKKHFKSFRKATKEEDIGGIDWWVTYPDSSEEVPVQFKLRDKQKDIPVSRFQPFHGVDHVKTIEGRDYRSLVGNKCSFYYVAIRNRTGTFTEIYNISCGKLKTSIEELNDGWSKSEVFQDRFPSVYFDTKRTTSWLSQGIWNKRVFFSDAGEVWWKKNRNEASPKFNMYVPYSCKDWNYELSSKDSTVVENLFMEWKKI